MSRAALRKAAEAFAASTPAELGVLYSTHPHWPIPPPSAKALGKRRQLDIAVLDSSFNPPTLAHRGIALSPALLAEEGQYDAHLLLFSCRNADKGTGKAGDATPVQRAEMMQILAQDLEKTLSEKSLPCNVAVAFVEPPLMMTKSTLCHEHIARVFREQEQDLPPIRLHWQAGMDTLERFFALRYYDSREAFLESSRHFFEVERTTFVAATRAQASLPGKAMESSSDDALLNSELVRPWVERKSIAVFQLPPEVEHCSSTDVRRICKEHREEDKRERLRGKVVDGIADYLVEEAMYE